MKTLKNQIPLRESLKWIAALTAVVLSVILVYRVIRFGEEKETVSHEAVVEKIRLMGKIQLVQFQIRDMVEYKVERNILPDSKVMMMVAGEIGACIDLEKLKESDVKRQKDKTVIILPSPEICYVKVNHEHSKIYHKLSWMLLDDDAELMDKAYKESEKFLQRPDVQWPALQEAEKNAPAILTPIFEKIAGQPVQISFGKQKLID